MNWVDYLLGQSWRLVLLAVLLAVSGFFSGTETAMFNLSRGQLYRLNRSQARTHRLVASLMRRPRKLLQTLLLGNMVVNIAYSAMIAVLVISLAARGLGGVAAAGVSVLGVLVLILAGEVTPKMLAYRIRERWAVAAAPPVAVALRVFSPVVRVLEAAFVAPLTRLLAPRREGLEITAGELGAILDLSVRRGLIGPDANAFLQEIVQLTDIRVADIMVPRVDMIAYDVNGPPGGLIDLFRKTHLRKVPVYDGDIDHVLGVVHAKRLLLDGGGDLRELVVKVPFLPEAANIERALLQLRVGRKQMAIVVDEYGGVAGLVTLEDIIEEIVGDIEETQEADRTRPVSRVGENEYLIDGDLAIHEWVDAFKIDLGGRRISTVGGFVISLLGRIPAVGDAADYRNLHFTVEGMRGRRISKLRLELTEEVT